MPYLVAPRIRKDMPGLWAEGAPYTTENIYDLCSGDEMSPPVNYDSHTLKPHSICHFDAPSHIIPGADTISDSIRKNSNLFFGPTIVIKLSGKNFEPHARAPLVSHWEVSLGELKDALSKYDLSLVEKVFITFDGATPDFFAEKGVALTLSIEAAEWLTSLPRFNLFGTSWKSADFQPGSKERPIHKIFFKNAGILECLNLTEVPEGIYFLSAFPLPLEGASESPVAPVLYSREEIRV